VAAHPLLGGVDLKGGEHEGMWRCGEQRSLRTWPVNCLGNTVKVAAEGCPRYRSMRYKAAQVRRQHTQHYILISCRHCDKGGVECITVHTVRGPNHRFGGGGVALRLVNIFVMVSL
jgi:hypothetical protein